jgi:hypothetical protein
MVAIARLAGLEFAAVFAGRCNSRIPGAKQENGGDHHAILRHLRQLMTLEAPLTKLEAQQRCMAEVPNAYPEAFKKAWAQLEPSRKRARGKHGRRAH